MYTPKLREDAIGVCVTFIGPGMTAYEIGFYPIQPMNEWATKCTDAESVDAQVERVGHMLVQAYEAGKRDRSAELRALLDVTTSR
jgi:hypothetical protein